MRTGWIYTLLERAVFLNHLLGVESISGCERSRLVEQLKPLRYNIAVCSQFKEAFGGSVGLQQVAILSKRQAFAAWFERWKTFGVADPPRGFAFAAFHIGSDNAGVYGLHLKSNLVKAGTERERQLNIFRRELAAEQLLAHIRQVGNLLTNELEAVVVAGDFLAIGGQNIAGLAKLLPNGALDTSFPGGSGPSIAGNPPLPARVDIARMNLLCAQGLPGAEDLDVDGSLAVLDEMAAETGRPLA